MKNIVLICFVLFWYFQMEAQRCGCIGGGTDMDTGNMSALGTIKLNDTCTFTFFKPINNIDSTRHRVYFVMLTIESTSNLDFDYKTDGQFELELNDSSTIVWDNVKYYTGKASIKNKESLRFMFNCTITEEQFKMISETPIVSLATYGILKFGFDEKMQKEQLKIVNCLIKEKVINK